MIVNELQKFQKIYARQLAAAQPLLSSVEGKLLPYDAAPLSEHVSIAS